MNSPDNPTPDPSEEAFDRAEKTRSEQQGGARPSREALLAMRLSAAIERGRRRVEKDPRQLSPHQPYTPEEIEAYTDGIKAAREKLGEVDTAEEEEDTFIGAETPEIEAERFALEAIKKKHLGESKE